MAPVRRTTAGESTTLLQKSLSAGTGGDPIEQLTIPFQRTPPRFGPGYGGLAGRATTQPDLPAGSPKRLQTRTGVVPVRREVQATGDAFARGAQIGEALRDEILALMAEKRALYGDRMGRWKEIATASQPLIEAYAPITFAEMQGMASVEGLEMETLLLLATEYEMHMGEGREVDGKCTGFAAMNEISGDLVMGQTNDETPAEWLGGAVDTVLHVSDEDGFETLTYTHPGNPAYMGMNSAGLGVLWQYIDDGDRNLEAGVPTNVLIREALTKTTLEDAIAYLEACPRTVPNNFLLAQEDRGIVDVECSPTRFTPHWVAEGNFNHANHIIIDEVMRARDTGIHNPETTTEARQETIDRMIPGRGHVSLARAKKALSTTPVLNPKTLATMIFEPRRGRMHIRFAGDDVKQFKVHELKRSR